MSVSRHVAFGARMSRYTSVFPIGALTVSSSSKHRETGLYSSDVSPARARQVVIGWLPVPRIQACVGQWGPGAPLSRRRGLQRGLRRSPRGDTVFELRTTPARVPRS